MEHRPIVITSGEPAGIGPDIVLQYASHTDQPSIVLGDPSVLDERARQLGLMCSIQELGDCESFPERPVSGTVYVWPVSVAERVIPGELNAANGPYVLALLDRAVEACQQGHAQAMVTAPVHKGVINDAGIPFTGHTEYLQMKTRSPHVVMLLANGGLRVALVTVHIPLSKVASSISVDGIVSVVRVVQEGLKHDFGIKQPRIAVCGLNPHAGEGGYLGDEEQRIIQPALEQLKTQGVTVSGPWAADTIFVPRHAQHFDAIVAMYHDQGLAAFKQASFGEGVNVTLGLPLIRVSVDHGTALSLAGTGHAEASSLHSACNLAYELVRHRYAHLATAT